MHLIRALVAGLVLLAVCNPGGSDEIEFRDRMKLAGHLMLRCEGPGGPIIPRHGWASFTVTLPRGCEKQASCRGWYRMSAEYFSFDVYSYERDHRRCQVHCKLEARADGLYGFNATTRGWDLITRYPIHPL